VTGKDFTVTLAKDTGVITSYKAHGVQLVKSGPAPNFWRAPIDNDRGNGQPSRNGTWRYAGADRHVTGVTVRPVAGQAVAIDVTGTLPTSTPSAYTTTYTVFGTGEIKVDNTLHPGASTLPYIPEVGTMLSLPGRFANIRYYGRGPDENYWDRRTASDGKGVGLLASGEPLLEFNASHFTPEDLSAGARHDYQLTPRSDVVLRLNYRQMGVGGDNSWGAQTHDAYKLFTDHDYRYTYRLRPLTSPDQAMDAYHHPIATP
jgi:beta-galactosidase